jgi:hypothetical protein
MLPYILIINKDHTETLPMLLQTSSAALADELAKTVAELDRLKEQQSTLENKNALLEKCLHLNLGQRTHQAMSEVCAEQRVS